MIECPSEQALAADLIKRLGVVRHLSGRAESELGKIERLIRRRYGPACLPTDPRDLPARLAAVEGLLLDRARPH